MGNSLSFVGRLGKDAETREAGSTTVTSFSIANNVGFGDKKQTMWYDCSLWGKQGERMAQYLKKGTMVFVSGEFSEREYKDKIYKQLEVKCIDFTPAASRASCPVIYLPLYIATRNTAPTLSMSLN